jgi:hypothetical protein
MPGNYSSYSDSLEQFYTALDNDVKGATGDSGSTKQDDRVDDSSRGSDGSDQGSSQS